MLDFIRGGKYDGKHALTLTFAMHAFAEGRNKHALEELLSTVDEQPVEVLGIRHFLLRMRVLEAILEETDEDDLDDLLDDEQAVELAEGTRYLIEHIIDDLPIREIVIEEFEHLSCVLQGFPQIINDTVDEAKIKFACAHDLTWIEMAKITDVLKLTRRVPKHDCGMTHHILQLVKTPDDWCKPKECIRRLTSIAEHFPQHAGEFLPTLAKRSGDEDSVVRGSARKALSKIKPEDIVISAMSILSAYNAGLSFFFVHHAFTFDLSTKRKIISFVLHTTSFKEVGKWNRDDTDAYVGSVRREFQAKFPGLLEHL